jgi:anti-sigma factor RsiW
MNERVHDVERLHDLADGRLPADEATAVRAHLSTCARCQQEFEAIAGARSAAARLRGDRPVPDALRAALTAALDAEDRAGIQPPRRPAPWSRRAVLGLAASAALVAGLWWRRRASDPVTSVVDAYERLSDGRLLLATRSSAAPAIEAYFRDVGPAVRVIDLSAMAFTLEGGLRHQVGGRQSALYAYRGPADALLVCQMFAGTVEDLPAADVVRDSGAFRFHVFVRRDVTAAFWQEGEIVCVLASTMPTDEVVALAMAKAMAPA